MGKKVSPALIGAFVVGAAALAVLGAVVFGSGRLFKKTSEFVLYFAGSVDGLAVGSPVKFKGVEVGAVREIRIQLGEFQPKDPRIPVFIEIDSARIASKGASVDPGSPENVHRLIELGLRGQLQPQSLLTGLLFVQLDMHPDSPAQFFLAEGSPPYQEIPTIPTVLEQAQSVIMGLVAKLQKADVEAMVDSAKSALDGIDHVANAPGLRNAIETLPQTMDRLNRALTSVQELAARLDGRTGPLIESVKNSSDDAGLALRQAQATFESVQSVLDPTSPLYVEAGTALHEMATAARAVRLLAEYLERNPSALVRGRATEDP